LRIRVALSTILALIPVAGLHGRTLLPQSTRSCEVPAAPTNLVTVVETATHTLTLTWKQPVASAAPTNHSVEVGNAPGSTYLGTLDTGSAKTSFTSPKPLDPGVYFVRVRAVNACGVSSRLARGARPGGPGPHRRAHQAGRRRREPDRDEKHILSDGGADEERRDCRRLLRQPRSRLFGRTHLHGA